MREGFLEEVASKLPWRWQMQTEPVQRRIAGNVSIGWRSCEGGPSSGNERPLKLMGSRCAEQGTGAQTVGVWCLSGSELG